MPAPRIDIISIGTLSRNRLWGENQIVRTAHATTTLIRSGKHNLLIDPGLPAPAIAARLHERAGLRPDQIDLVFLTNFKPAHRAGLSAFTSARCLIHPIERETAQAELQALIDQAPEQDIDRRQLLAELALVNQIEPADDQLLPHIDLFPLFGYSAGQCGLLASLPMTTVLIAGDAVPTLDHFLSGQVLPDTQSGFRVYPLGATLALAATGSRYDFETEILLRAARRGIPLVGVPVRVYYPPIAERVSHFDPWTDTLRIIGTVLRVLVSPG